MSVLHDEEMQDLFIEHGCLTIDGFDDCCIGTTYNFRQPQLVYSAVLIVAQLLEEGMQDIEALEYLEYNIVDGIPNKPEAPVIIFDI